LIIFNYLPAIFRRRSIVGVRPTAATAVLKPYGRTEPSADCHQK
jgi:hypothetical protein